MQCRSVLTRIDALRTSELPAEEAGEVTQHLASCPSCDESVGDLEHLARAVKVLTVAPPRSCRDAVCDRYDSIDVEGQQVRVAFSSKGLTMIHAGGSEEEFRARYAERCGRELEPESLPEKLRAQVAAAISGKGVSKPAVDLSAAGDFEREVLEILTRIPRGEVRTYSWVAQQAGRPAATRAVGNICARNVLPFVVPCHRVVPTAGGVGNYAFGAPVKRRLLEREGVPLRDLEELARKHIRFTGSKSTKIFCNPTCRDARRIRDQNRILFHDADEAMEKGFRPCKRCLPIAA
ncbi:MAG TPA: methylated-DNA--[protein]-cysteine S-methyltransferase [Thermoanaerobaculia bacterium]|nr:methylated-DNA--[protein]-cysteine S-methyltransferase [Thermoanaerobaculia bacterium]